MRSKGERSRLTVRLPIHMRDELYGIALERGLTVNDLLIEIIIPVTACKQAREEAARRFPVYAVEPNLETWLAWAKAISTTVSEE